MKQRVLVALLAALTTMASACASGDSGATTTTGTEITSTTAAEQQTTTSVEAPPSTTAPAATAPTAPEIFCGPECQQALTLQAAVEDVACSVGVAWSTAQHPYGATALARSEEVALLFPNMEMTTADGRGDSATQTSQVEDMVAAGIDVLVLSPVDSEALVGAVTAAIDAGVKVITADRTVSNVDVLSYIGADNVLAGRAAGEFIVERLGGVGAMVELQGIPGSSPAIDRGAGLREALEGSDVEILDSQNGEFAREQGLQVMEDFLQRFGPGEIDAVFAHNDEMALGAVQAIEEAGREGDGIVVVGVDGQASALESIKAGGMTASSVYPIPVPEAILAAAKACVGEELPTRITQVSQMVTEENVADFEGAVGF